MPRPPRKVILPAHRPKLKIDWKEVNRALECGCTGMQIASVLGMCSDTLYDRCITEQGVTFSEYKQNHSAKGEFDILAKMHEDALGKSKIKGNATLLMRLAEVRVGHKSAKDVSLAITSFADLSKIASSGQLENLLAQGELASDDQVAAEKEDL